MVLGEVEFVDIVIVVVLIGDYDDYFFVLCVDVNLDFYFVYGIKVMIIWDGQVVVVFVDFFICGFLQIWMCWFVVLCGLEIGLFVGLLQGWLWVLLIDVLLVLLVFW